MVQRGLFILVRCIHISAELTNEDADGFDVSIAQRGLFVLSLAFTSAPNSLTRKRTVERDDDRRSAKAGHQ